MKTLLPGTIALVLALPTVAAAHRLDEYLQATRIALTPDRVQLEIDLTPGVAIASEIFAAIDRDSDGRVTGREIEAYARGVLNDLTIQVDGEAYVLTMTRAECPSWSEISEGLGTIRVEATSDVPLRSSGPHRVRYDNAHDPGRSVYLVNALAPATREVAIVGQQRDTRQHGIELDLVVRTRGAVSPWILLQCFGLIALLIYRRATFRSPFATASAVRDRKSE